MKRKALRKLRPGALLEILWLDTPPEVAILVAPFGKKDVGLQLYHPKRGTVDSHARPEQVSHFIKDLYIPDRVSPKSRRFIKKRQEVA